jgi:hypothetical protein
LVLSPLISCDQCKRNDEESVLPTVATILA